MAQIYIETHGCQMNEADSQDIQRRAISAGFKNVVLMSDHGGGGQAQRKGEREKGERTLHGARSAGTGARCQ